MGVCVANADDAPGAAAVGMLLMVAGVILACGPRATGSPCEQPAPPWPSGALVAAFAAVLTHGVVVAPPLFSPSAEAPSAGASPVAPKHGLALEHAREAVRRAMREQNLPGMHVADAITEQSR